MDFFELRAEASNEYSTGTTYSSEDFDFPKKKQTNADRIRNMTDEELADLLLSQQCSVCDFQGFCDDDETPNHSKMCKNEIREWLKQEVEE